MILYNVTVKIDKKVAEKWLRWMKSKHIPDVMNTGYFVEYRISKLLYQDDADGITFVTQYSCPDITALQNYMSEKAEALQKEHHKKFEGQYVAFRTIMETCEN